MKIAIWRPIFWPRDLLIQPIRTIWTILVGDHPGTIPVEFGHIPISGSRKEVVWRFSYIIQCKIVTPRVGPTYATNQNYLNNFDRGQLRDHACEVWSKSNEWFQRWRCLSKKVYGRRTTTDDGPRPVTIAHPEKCNWESVLRLYQTVLSLSRHMQRLPTFFRNLFSNISHIEKILGT